VRVESSLIMLSVGYSLVLRWLISLLFIFMILCR
jgi:hypothetical protein